MVKKQDDIPENVNKELESPKFGKPSELTASGYILDVNETANSFADTYNGLALDNLLTLASNPDWRLNTCISPFNMLNTKKSKIL